MDTLEVSTVAYLPPREVYEFLLDFPGYADYSKYLRRVRASGDGGPGTEYALEFQWWKLRYVARSRVTAVDPPDRIDWEVTKDLRARGAWRVEEAPAAAPDGAETATRVTLEVDYDPDSVGEDVVDLPRFVGLSWLVRRVEGLIREEGERVVERIVADLEGERRPVELTVRVNGDPLSA